MRLLVLHNALPYTLIDELDHILILEWIQLLIIKLVEPFDSFTCLDKFDILVRVYLELQ